MESNYLFAGSILQRRSEEGRERGRVETQCCFTMCLKNWGRQSVVESEKWEEGDEDWEADVGKKS